MTFDPIEFARALVRRRSVTPADDGALDLVEAALSEFGFRCTRLKFEDVDNLHATIGSGAPHFCYAGHTDVVPAGDPAGWSSPPFEAELRDGAIWGRGVADMKGGIAAFIAAVARIIKNGGPEGALTLIITGDEEGPALHGTKRVLDWMREHALSFNHCLVGEPSSSAQLGDMMKVGRRGSTNSVLTVIGRQGHVAYPDRAKNPVPALMRKLLFLSETALDEGYERFPPSSLQVTDIHIGNPAHNVIPEKATAKFNIRFNPNWTGETITTWLHENISRLADDEGVKHRLDVTVTGEAFLTTDAAFISFVADCIEERAGQRPEYSTTGGTSDARFIKDIAPVIEFGLVGATIHQTDEHIAVAEIIALADIYELILSRYYARFRKAP